MTNIFKIVFFDSTFLPLTDEKVGKKRSTTEKIVLIHQRIQIINFFKSLDLTRKMRNVIKLFCTITNRRTIYSLSILMIACYRPCQSEASTKNPARETSFCAHQTTLPITPFFWFMVSHLNSVPALLQFLLGICDYLLDMQGGFWIWHTTRWNLIIIFKPLPQPASKISLPSYL